MNEQFLYPKDLKSQPKLWLWSLRDIVIIGVALLISVLALSQLKLFFPLAISAAYAFLTIRKDDNTVLEFLFRGIRYFCTTQQYFEWSPQEIGKHVDPEERSDSQ